MAVAGIVLGLVLTALPVRAGSMECGSVAEYLRGEGIFFEGGGWFGYSPQTGARFGDIVDCRTGLRRRGAVAFTVGTLMTLPLTVLTIRGFLWGAATLHRIAERLEADERDDPA